MNLKRGSKGDTVKYLQQGLRMLCINPNGTDGIFGAGTETAVKKFQTKNGLSATGIVDDATWNKMKAQIIPIQKALINAGYKIGEADGIAGNNTYNSVIDFQKKHGLTADGMVGSKTMQLLQNANKPTSTVLKIGSKGEEVKKVQTRLIELGYSCGSSGADGDFGQGTYNAVVAFQKRNGLSVDGIVGENTITKLFSNAAIKNASSTVLKKGMSGESVKRMQQRLIELGYSCGRAGADGSFGSGTYAAVYEFQRCNGLDMDGIAGEKTLSTLYSTSAKKYTPDATVPTVSPSPSINNSGDLVDYAIHVILNGEGNYTAINDTDPISIGILQWHEERAHDLLVAMYARDANAVENTLGKNSKLVSEIKADRSVFVGRYLTAGEKEAVKLLLDSTLGHTIQDETARTDVSGYIDYGKKCNIKDEHALIYYADLYNQSPKQTKIIVESITGEITLDKIHSAAMNNPVMNKYSTRRNNAYYAAKEYSSSNSGISGLSNDTSNSALEKFVNIALGEFGYKEKGENITKYGEWYGDNGEPWCAMFVSWCASQAGIKANPNGLVPRYEDVSAGMEAYINAKRFQYKASYTPKYGDIMFLKSNGASHTAIVVGYDKNAKKVYTIEGNFSDKVCKVWRNADNNEITGYGVNGGTSDGYVLKDAVAAKGSTL